MYKTNQIFYLPTFYSPTFLLMIVPNDKNKTPEWRGTTIRYFKEYFLLYNTKFRVSLRWFDVAKVTIRHRPQF